MALPPISGAPAPAQPAKPASDARTAAQRAFFDTALRRAQAPAAVQTAAAPTAAAKPAAAATPARAQPMAQTADEPQRPLRPGSLLNIVV